jgi:hypothetical protein
MKRLLCLLATLSCLGAPTPKAPDLLQLDLTYSERNGAAGPSGLFGDMANSMTVSMGAAVGLFDSLQNLGKLLGGNGQAPPKTGGEMGRLLSSPRGLAITSLIPRNSGYRAQLQARLQWNPAKKAYLVKSGNLVWIADNNSRFQSGPHLQFSKLSAGGTYTLKPEDVTVTFKSGQRSAAMAAGAKDDQDTYTLKLEMAPKPEPVIGESGWIAGGGGVYEARAKYTSAGVEVIGTKEYKPTADGNDMVAKPPEKYETLPAELYSHKLTYNAEDRTVQGGKGTFAEAWVDMTGSAVSISWQLGLPAATVKITSLKQEGGARTGDPAQLVFESGTLRFKAEAKVQPFQDAEALRWDAPDLGATKAKVESRVREDGVVEATITYQGLPAENSAFGSKFLKARVRKEEAEKRFQVFFEEKGKDNPEGGQVPNWYYYWKQGPVPLLEDFAYEEDASKAGGYSPSNGRLMVTSVTVGVIPALDAILQKADPYWGLHTYHLQRERREHLEAVGATVAHELKHRDLFTMKGPHRPSDGDGVEDAVEDGSIDPWLDKTDPNTYTNFNISLFYGDTGDYVKNDKDGSKESRQETVDKATYQLRIAGDNELLAIIAERSLVVHAGQDWAFPGSQATGKQ